MNGGHFQLFGLLQQSRLIHFIREYWMQGFYVLIRQRRSLCNILQYYLTHFPLHICTFMGFYRRFAQLPLPSLKYRLYLLLQGVHFTRVHITTLLVLFRTEFTPRRTMMVERPHRFSLILVLPLPRILTPSQTQTDVDLVGELRTYVCYVLLTLEPFHRLHMLFLE